jgi:hypothetical protein
VARFESAELISSSRRCSRSARRKELDRRSSPGLARGPRPTPAADEIRDLGSDSSSALEPRSRSLATIRQPGGPSFRQRIDHRVGRAVPTDHVQLVRRGCLCSLARSAQLPATTKRPSAGGERTAPRACTARAGSASRASRDEHGAHAYALKRARTTDKLRPARGARSSFPAATGRTRLPGSTSSRGYASRLEVRGECDLLCPSPLARHVRRSASVIAKAVDAPRACRASPRSTSRSKTRHEIAAGWPPRTMRDPAERRTSWRCARDVPAATNRSKRESGRKRSRGRARRHAPSPRGPACDAQRDERWHWFGRKGSFVPKTRLSTPRGAGHRGHGPRTNTRGKSATPPGALPSARAPNAVASTTTSATASVELPLAKNRRRCSRSRARLYPATRRLPAP